MKTYSIAEKTLHRCLKFGRRGDPNLIGQFDDRFTRTERREMQ